MSTSAPPTKHLDPARSVIAKMGGVEVVARVTGKSVSRVYRWMRPRDVGGTDGFIPHADARRLLRHAGENDIELSPADFFADALDSPTSNVSTGAAA